MRILMTGGSGVLGRASRPFLSEAGHRIDAPRREELDLFDPAVDDQMINVCELANHPDRSAGDGARERRHARFEKAQVRIERRVREAQRHLGIHLIVERDTPGS